MDPGSSDMSDGPKPKRLKTSALGMKFSGGNTLLHEFVLQNSDPNESGSENYINAVLLSMSDAAADVVNALNNEGSSALGLAVLKDNRIMVKKLLSCLVHVDVDATCRRRYNRASALHLATELGHLTIIRELLNKGAGIDIRNAYEETPLCVAAKSGHLDIVKFLVSKGANVNPIGGYDTPLSYAAESENSAIVEFLVSSGADISARGWRALREAAWSGNLDILKFLLDRCVNFDIKSESGCAVLLSALSENLATVEFLVRKGADVNAKNKYGDTPLHTAAYIGSSIAIVQFLIDQSADLDARDEEGNTPLHIATKRGNADIAELLIGKGADLHAKNIDGETPLHFAVLFGKIECVAFLIDQGADLHTTDVMGWTPLHTAAFEGHAAMIRLLLDKGADVEAKNKDGETPLDLARENGKQSCMDALQNIRQ